MGQCLTQYQGALAALPESARSDYLIAMITIGICLMNRAFGLEFTEGFLLAAINEPTAITLEPPATH